MVIFYFFLIFYISQRVAPIAAAQPKASVNTPVVAQRSSSTGSSSSIVDNYINTLTHLSGSSTAVSITPAKPKEKAVIDLTDEDEAPQQTSSSQSTAQNTVPHTQRRNLPVQNNTNSQLQYGRSAPPLARIPPAPNNKNRQMSAIQGRSLTLLFDKIERIIQRFCLFVSSKEQQFVCSH